MPAGDWLMPKDSIYGGWPQSGEIDLMETRGNRQLFHENTNLGVEQAGSTIHFGPSHSNKNHWPLFILRKTIRLDITKDSVFTD